MNPILKSILIAIGILIAATFAFTFIVYEGPTPEILSPWLYLVAAGVCLVQLFRLPQRRRIWIYLPILLLCILGFLEETSYGVESGGAQAIYSETYNVEIYDVHNLIPILEQILTKDMQRADWNFALSNQYLVADGVALLAALFLLIGVTHRSNQPQGQQTLQALAIAFVALGLAAAAWLLSLPGDSKNAVLLGYSAQRLLMLLALLLAAAAPLWAAFRPKAAAAIDKVLAVRRNRWLLTLFFAVLLIAGLAYQVLSPLRAADASLALIQRLNPLIHFGFAAALLLLFAIHAWHGGLQRLLGRMWSFIIENPAYVFVAFCILTIIFTQAMDQDRISLREYIGFANPWGEDWNYWLEELWEMTAALQLLAAALVFPTQKKISK
jgi:hypothetical protein